MIVFIDVTRVYPNGHKAISNLSLNLRPSEFCVILGPSGAGKSTLLQLVSGLHGLDSGEILFDGISVISSNLKKIRPRLGMIHQQFHLVDRLTVLENVLCGALPAISSFRAYTGIFPEKLRRKACVLINEVGLTEEFLYRRASNLSGGQQQRVGIARAFMMNPDVVLADEPIASLDPRTSEDIMELLKYESVKAKSTVLCSLHQVELAKKFADRIIGLREGNIVFDGSPEQLNEIALQVIYGQVTPKPKVVSVHDCLEKDNSEFNEVRFH